MIDKREIERRHTVQWCAGLPLVEERKLGRDERTELACLAWGFLGKSAIILLATAVGTVPPLLTALRLFDTQDWAVFAVIGLSLIIAAVVGALAVAREGWLQRSLLLFLDLSRGSVKTFSGCLSEADRLRTVDEEDPTQARLLKHGLITLGGAQFQTVEVLPVSCRIWRVGGDALRPWLSAQWTEVAKPPEAIRLWLHSNTEPFARDGALRRRLSLTEEKELRRETLVHWLMPFIAAAVCTTIITVEIVTLTAARTAPGPSEWWGLLHWGLGAIGADILFMRRSLMALGMHQDLRGGTVEVTSIPVSGRNGRSSEISERLPHSRRVWTQAGIPAAWRRIPRQ